MNEFSASSGGFNDGILKMVAPTDMLLTGIGIDGVTCDLIPNLPFPKGSEITLKVPGPHLIEFKWME